MLTARDIVNQISLLPEGSFKYLDPKNKNIIKIVDIVYPEGPIKFVRYSTKKASSNQRPVSISTNSLWRLSNAIKPGIPINIDRVFGASFNYRSALEALLANCPEFFYCYPGRIENVNNSSKIKKGHKHLIWSPDRTHEAGIVEEIKTDLVISEIPSNEIIYDAIEFDPESLRGIDIEAKRRHVQIQIALMEIAIFLGYRIWIASNDKGILYKNKRLGEYPSVIPDLKKEALISSFSDAIKSALFIDCIWFRNSRFMPAVMEIEESTGITSGLTRMKSFKDKSPDFNTRYVIVASDESRNEVIRKCSEAQFKDLNPRYFSYSAVEELYSLCSRRKIRGITEEFLDSFIEPVFN